LTSDGVFKYTYDNEGNRTAKVSKKSRTEYFWDHRNRLVKVVADGKIVEYVYDHLNRLLRRNDEFFVHDGWQIVLTLDSKGKIKEQFLWGAKQDELLCENDRWTLCDHLGTIRDIVDENGKIVSHLEYNAFGELLEVSGTKTRFRYTGKLNDDVTSLQWNVNRWYDVKAGRWCNEDPKGFKAKEVNIYRYVKNSVLSNNDYWGLASNPVSQFSCCKEFDLMYNVVPLSATGLTDWEKGEECRKYLLDDVWWNDTLNQLLLAATEAALAAGGKLTTAISVTVTVPGTSIVITTIETTVGAVLAALALGGAIGYFLGYTLSYADATAICNSYTCKVAGGTPNCSCSKGVLWGYTWLCRCPYGQEIYKHNSSGRYTINPSYHSNYTEVNQNW
jgi:RHS repeat-associated protein